MSRNKYLIVEDYSWFQLEIDIIALSQKIKKEFEPDVVICISTGGWIPGRLLKNYLSASFYSIGCLAYNEEGNYTGSVSIKQKLSIDIDIFGKKVLIVDEVCETGNTLKMVTEYILTFNPLKVFSCVIHQKNHAEFKADFFVYEVCDKWIKYPWSKV